VTARVITVASLGIFRASAPSLVAAVVADTVVAAAVGPLPATTATRRDIFPGSVPREAVAADGVVVAAAVVATATTVVNRAIFPVTALSRDRVAVASAVAAAETATIAGSRVIFPGTARSRARAAAVVVVSVDAITYNAIVAKDTGICLANAPSEFQLEMFQAFSINR